MIYRYSLIFLLLVLVSSCARPKEFPLTGEFEGIKTALQRQDCVNVVMIHGMGGYSYGDPDTLKNAIVNQLQLCKSGPDCVREIVGESTGSPYYYGDLTKEEYRSLCNGKTVRFYVINWHPTVDAQKKRLYQIDRHMSARREKSIQEIKTTLINQTSADTFLYFSAFRSEMEHPIIQSIRWIVEDSKSLSSTDNFVVGYSMGGTLFINSVISMRHGEASNQEIAKNFISNTAAVYFLSNGYPLAELVEDHPEKKYEYDDSQNCELTAITQNLQDDIWNWKKSPIGLFIHEKRESCPNFQIVSFYDPNDIFGYYVTEYPVPGKYGDKNAFLNECVINARPSAFSFLDPRESHTGYGKNPRVISLIINGLSSQYCKNTCYTEAN